MIATDICIPRVPIMPALAPIDKGVLMIPLASSIPISPECGGFPKVGEPGAGIRSKGFLSSRLL